jgi:hypothetical protein
MGKEMTTDATGGSAPKPVCLAWAETYDLKGGCRKERQRTVEKRKVGAATYQLEEG